MEAHARAMWLISLRDLQWRRRRFLIAVVSAALAFALTLLLEGTVAHMRSEGPRVVNLFGAVTFDRYWKFYRGGGNAYDVVVSH